MDQVLAKIKGHGKKTIYKLLSDQKLFDDINITSGNCVEYNPDHNLDEDSWFQIEQFSEKPYCLEFLKDEFIFSELDELSKSNFSDIAYVCAIQGDSYCFQKITKSLFLNKKKMISFGEVAKLESLDNSLTIKALPDAIYQKNNDTLVFRNLATINSVFKGIDEIYKEATNEEVEQFFEEPFIEASEEYTVENVSKLNRKRIALAMTTLDDMPEGDRGTMLSYMHEYCENKLKINKDNNTVKVETDEELKLLLYGIEQRFYTTPLGNEKRLANSVQALE